MLEVFIDWSANNVVANIARIVFFIILFVLFWFVLAVASFPQQRVLRILFSLIVSFLAVFFIDAGELLVIFQGYIALGMVVVAIIPFLVLIPISVFLVSRGKKQFGRKLYLLLWFLFVVFLAYQLFSNYVFGGENLLVELGWAYIVGVIVFLISVLFLIFHRKFESFVYKTQKDIEEGKTKQGLLVSKAMAKRKR